jgi:hypothetical protein
MGNVCNYLPINKNDEVTMERDLYVDVKLKRYKSSNDYYYEAFEKKHNLLNYIQLSEYSILFCNFNFDNKNKELLQKQRMFTEDLEKSEFLSFFKTKIINNHLIYSLKEDNDSKQIFIDFLGKLYDIIGKGLLSYIRVNNKKGEVQIKDKKQKKYFLVALGILFCQSDNTTKIDYLFEAFSNDLNKIEASSHFQIFLYVFFLIASFAGISIIHEISKIYPKAIQTFNEEDYLKTLEIYQVQDIIEIKDQFVKNFFGASESLTYFEYRDKLINDGYDWVLTASGIRATLEKKTKQN